jgi:hypothetical protein
MIDTVPAVAIAAMLDYAHEQDDNDTLKPIWNGLTRPIRAAYLQCGEVALREATLREDGHARINLKLHGSIALSSPQIRKVSAAYERLFSACI